jgi:hypothetical protein
MIFGSSVSITRQNCIFYFARLNPFFQAWSIRGNNLSYKTVMKTVKILTTLTVVAFAAFATAVEKPKMEVIPLSADRAVVAIANNHAAYFELSMIAANGELIYYKQSSQPLTDYRQVFDFGNLEEGNYVLNLKVNDTQLIKNVEVNRSKISVGDSMLRFDPYFEFRDNLLKFSYLNFDQENMKLLIYKDENVIYSSKLGNDFTISNGCDLSKLSAGNYKVVLNSYNKEFSYDLVK